MSATFLDDMVRRFRGSQFFTVTIPQTKDRTDRSSEPARQQQTGLAEHEALYRSVQDRSYYLWKEAGEPEGRADEFWRQSLHEHLSQRAREIWEREGHPTGRENEHWYQACRDLEQAGLKS